jgi:hypothetical protein
MFNAELHPHDAILSAPETVRDVHSWAARWSARREREGERVGRIFGSVPRLRR